MLAHLRPLEERVLELVRAGVGKKDSAMKAREAEATRIRNFLPAARKKAAEEEFRRAKKAAQAAKNETFDATRHTAGLRVQRKIHHLLTSQVGKKPGFSMGFMQAQPRIDHLYTTTTIHLTLNDVPTLFTRSSASKSPSKSITTHQNPRFFPPLRPG